MFKKHKKLFTIISIILIFIGIHKYRNRYLETTYTSKFHNFTMTFPGNWHGKYKIIEKENYLTVCLNKLSDIELFTITTDLNETLDSIPNVEKNKVINGTKFLIGSPTGCPYSELTPKSTIKQYSDLRYEIHLVIDSIN